MKFSYRRLTGGLAVVLCCATSQAGPATDKSSTPETDWLRYAPGDAGFYAELRDLHGIRQQFRLLGIWRTVRELGEQDAIRTTSQPWQQRTHELLGLNAEAAVSLLLGRRVALIAENSGRWQDGVVMAELSEPSRLRPLLRLWRARAQASEGPVRRYVLRGGILLAVRDSTLVLGPVGDPDGLWSRTVLLLSGRRGPSLHGRAEFAGLRSRLSRSDSGLLYAVWPDGSPIAFEGCDRLVVGISVEPDGMLCEFRGSRGVDGTETLCFDASTLGALPAETVAVWSGSFDFSALAPGADSVLGRSEDPLLPVFLSAFTGYGAGTENSLTQIGPKWVVVVGTEQSASSADLRMPAVTALVETRDGRRIIERLDNVVGTLGGIISYLSSSDRERRPVGLEVVRTQVEDVELHSIDLGPVLALRTGLDFLAVVRPCWALFDNHLVVSTSMAHVGEIVRSTRGKTRRLVEAEETTRLLPSDSSDEVVAEWVFLHGGRVSEMFGSWLRHMRRRYPETMQPTWWQSWAAERLEDRGRLGLGLGSARGEGPGPVVREVTPTSPAKGIVRVGDVVVGAVGRPLPKTGAAQEVARRYNQRGASRVFEMDVLRDGKQIKLEIPVLPSAIGHLGDFDPVEALKGLITLTRRTETVTVWRFAQGSDRYDARIEIRWDLEARADK